MFKIQISFLDFDDIFDPNKIINNSDSIDSKTKKFNQDGIFSEKIFGKLEANSIQFSCNCGKLKGKFYKDNICDACETKVEYIEPGIKKLGWITFGDFIIINPIFFNFIEKIIGKKNFTEILAFNKKLDKDGVIIEEDKVEYNNIGLLNFIENFDEILGFYLNKNKKKIDIYNLIMRNRDIVFINKFPVYSTVLRPALMISNNLIFDEINNLYNIVIKNSNVLKELIDDEKTDLNISPILMNMQLAANQVFEKVINNIRGKAGFIRSNVMGKVFKIAHLKLS